MDLNNMNLMFGVNQNHSVIGGFIKTLVWIVVIICLFAFFTLE